jgi:hypothetical protein
MKFRLHFIITIAICFVLLGAVIITSCEQDPCTNQNCLNGGSCGYGVCKCPTGFDGTYCQTRTIDRFIGAYAGYSKCNGGAFVIDSVFILAAPQLGPLSVKFVMHTNPSDTLYGTAGINQSVYSLLIPVVTATNYSKEYTVTLQNNNSLVVQTYETNTINPLLPVVNNCVFNGVLTTLR